MGMIIIDKETDREFEILDRGMRWQGTHRLWNGRVEPLVKDMVPPQPEVLLILQRKTHVFGGVVFEETGESRVARKGDWTFFAAKCPTYWEHDDQGGAWSVILRPVAIEDQP